MICEYEITVLRRIAAGDTPSDPGAAYCQAIEALVGSGHIKAGKLTERGRDALKKEAAE